MSNEHNQELPRSSAEPLSSRDEAFARSLQLQESQSTLSSSSSSLSSDAITSPDSLNYRLFPEVFETMASKFPERTALTDPANNISYTYEDLYNRVNQLAEYLRLEVLKNKWENLPPTPLEENSSLKKNEIPVGVFLPASAEAVIAILAIWKAGLVYVPLGVRDDRFGQTVMAVTQSEPKIIISNEIYKDKYISYANEHAQKDKATEHTELCLPKLIDIKDAERLIETDKLYEFKGNCLSSKNEADKSRAAYIFYSSGSTGIPKGIIIEHRGMWHPMHSITHMKFNADNINLTMNEKYVVAQFAELTFDASILEIMMTLGVGASLVIVPENIRTDARNLSDFFKDNNISVCTFTPAMLANLDPTCFPEFKFIISTGEKLPRAVLDKWTRAGITIVNGYGPSEVTIATSLGLCAADDIHIGQPIDKLKIHILGSKKDTDDKNKLQYKDSLSKEDKAALLSVSNKLNDGEKGELYIESPGLARGYLGQPVLTASRFLKLTIDGKKTRVYRTRDAGYKDKGNYYTTGRLDRQTKVYGQLFNPEAVDDIIGKDAINVQRAYTHVQTQKDASGQEHPIITAYILLQPGSTLCTLIAAKRADADRNCKIDLFPELKEFFIQTRTRLTSLSYYQIPSRWCIINEIAFSPNQKADTAKLNEKTITRSFLLHADGNPIVPADSLSVESIEIKLANKWRDILRLDKNEPIYPEDNFLWLGGTSIHYLQLQLWLQDEYHCTDSPSFLAFYQNGTFQEMAMWIHLQTTKTTLVKPLKSNNPDRGRENKFPLILIHALWGNANIDYADFKKLNHGSREIYVISAPGLQDQHLICSDINTLAACYAKAIRETIPDSGYIIAGWSTGGAIANAVTSILSKDGHWVAGIMLDTLLPKSQPTKDQCDAIKEHFIFTANKLEWNKNPAINLEEAEFKEAYEKISDPIKLINELFKLLLIKRSGSPDPKELQIKTIHSLMIALHRYQPMENKGLMCLLKAESTCSTYDGDSYLGWTAVKPIQYSTLLPGDHHSIKNGCPLEWFNILLQTSNKLEAEVRLRDIQAQLKNAYRIRYQNEPFDFRVQATDCIAVSSFQDLFRDRKQNEASTYVLSTNSGMGKTATLKAIALAWAEEKLPCFKMVILISINDFIRENEVLTVEDFIIAQLQLETNLDQEKDLIKKYFGDLPKENILLLIDDYQLAPENLSTHTIKNLIQICLGKYDCLLSITSDVHDQTLEQLNQKNPKLLSLTPLAHQHNAKKDKKNFSVLTAQSQNQQSCLATVPEKRIVAVTINTNNAYDLTGNDVPHVTEHMMKISTLKPITPDPVNNATVIDSLTYNSGNLYFARSTAPSQAQSNLPTTPFWKLDYFKTITASQGLKDDFENLKSKGYKFSVTLISGLASGSTAMIQIQATAPNDYRDITVKNDLDLLKNDLEDILNSARITSYNDKLASDNRSLFITDSPEILRSLHGLLCDLAQSTLSALSETNSDANYSCVVS